MSRLLHLVDGRTTTEGTCELNPDNINYIRLTDTTISLQSTIRELKEACVRELNRRLAVGSTPLRAEQLRLIYLTNKSPSSLSSTCRPLTDLAIDERTLLDYEIANGSWLMVKQKFIPSSHPVASGMETDENEEVGVETEEGEEKEWTNGRVGDDITKEDAADEHFTVESEETLTTPMDELSHLPSAVDFVEDSPAAPAGDDSTGHSSTSWLPSNTPRPETNDIDRHSFSHCLTFLPSHERCLLSRVCHAFQHAVMDRLSGWSIHWVHLPTPERFLSFPSYYHPLVVRLSLGQKRPPKNWDDDDDVDGWSMLPHDSFHSFTRLAAIKLGESGSHILALEQFWHSEQVQFESLHLYLLDETTFRTESIPAGLHHLKVIHLDSQFNDLLYIVHLIQVCCHSLESFTLPGQHDRELREHLQIALSLCPRLTTLAMPSELFHDWSPSTPHLTSLQQFHETRPYLPTPILFVVAPNLTSLSFTYWSTHQKTSNDVTPVTAIQAICAFVNLRTLSFDVHVTPGPFKWRKFNLTEFSREFFERAPFHLLLNHNASYLRLVESTLRVDEYEVAYSSRWKHEEPDSLVRKPSTPVISPSTSTSSDAPTAAATFIGVPVCLLQHVTMPRLELDQITPDDVGALAQLPPTLVHLTMSLTCTEISYGSFWSAISNQINLESLVFQSPGLHMPLLDGSELNRLPQIATKLQRLRQVVIHQTFHLYQTQFTQFLSQLPALQTIHITLHPEQSLSTICQLLTDLCQSLPTPSSTAAERGPFSLPATSPAKTGRSFHSLEITLGRSVLSPQDHAALDQIEELANRYQLRSCQINNP